MGIQMRVSVVVGLVLCLISVVSAIQGNAVFYQPPYSPSACYGNQNNGNMVAGVSDALWNNKGACGRKYKVSCIGGANEAPHPCKQGKSVVVKVVDYCRQGCQGIINLSQDAFSVIADTNAGIVKVDMKQV